MMSDLKACPFCGRIPDIEVGGKHRWFIRCKCGIAQDKLFFHKCDAVRDWNKRKELRVKDTNVPITDIISRQAAIDEILEHRGAEYHNEYECGYDDALRDAVEWLKRLPSAEPEPSDVARDIATIIGNTKDMRVIAEPRKGKWIPFSERFPEANRVVLLAFSHNAVVGYWIDRLPDGKPIWYAATGNGWATDIDCENYGYPTAWMPVPDVLGGEANED